MTLLCCKLIKMKSFFVILRDAKTMMIEKAKIVLSSSMTLLCCKLVKMPSFFVILRYAKTMMIEIAKIVLSGSKTLLCCKLVNMPSFFGNLALRQDHDDRDCQDRFEPKHYLALLQ
jgi:hypothetical protein